jgi:hypothetical protein
VHGSWQAGLLVLCKLTCSILAVHASRTYADIVVTSRDLVLMLCRLLVWLVRCCLWWLAVP